MRDESLLYQRVADRSMPPEKELPLSEEKIALIGRWIVAAPPSNAAEEAPLRETDSAVPAEAREFWFFRRLQPDKVPQVSNGARAHAGRCFSACAT